MNPGFRSVGTFREESSRFVVFLIEEVEACDGRVFSGEAAA